MDVNALAAMLGGQTDPQALASALRGQRIIGMLGMGADKGLDPLAQSLFKDSQMQQAQAQETQGARLRMALDQAKQAEQQRQFNVETALKKQSLEQDAWGTIADPVTGGIVMFNKKTGETRPLGPGGGKPGTGVLPPPKPKDMEDDVQKLGKDMSEVAKLQPDLDVLNKVAGQEDIPGFGPVEGRIPLMFRGTEAVEPRQAAGRLMANLLHMISGSAVSEGEVNRNLEARGLGATATPEQFRSGVKALERDIAEQQRLIKAKYHPAVVDTYLGRGGGVKSAPAAEAPSAAPQRAQGKDGKWYRLGPNGWEAE